ncbi:hypothetical protein CONPUDRAFT_145476 [Coniophora puteana RWD-64-598 SS2]|uniref:DUF6533 domain-containing protein n=1 Tax=Coniophora puteana (strain RWD-64-598) TaxID=741705 RepID=A0A5M3MHM6_CONPW|nr:uncharacterized protein CONPUDRAFT_145476 [Coniophora puteana RWD-64-598 SS2]EIW78131.1 hypothetical protein CONPUDRAFT_145476 [Coniophora puteana RWD-64-598 SS2]
MSAGPAEGLQLVRYFNLAGAIILLYDHLLTSKWEAQYYLQGRLGFAKIIFIVCRYLAYPGVAMAVQLLRVVSILLAEFLLCIRIWILWERSKRMLYTLVGVATPLSFGPAYHFCADQVSLNASIVAAIVASYEIVLLLLVLLRWRYLRKCNSVGTLTSLLVKDGVLYIVGVIAISLTIVIIGFTFSTPEAYFRDCSQNTAPCLKGFAIGDPVGKDTDTYNSIQVSIHSAMACRIMLNLVKNDRETHSTTAKGDDFNSVVFAGPQATSRHSSSSDLSACAV